ncbi:MAG: hypothetical protein PHV32_15165 [Eubacteriales bacterium]|nr:hypothetical protein [Eubacteriales bacterium]
MFFHIIKTTLKRIIFLFLIALLLICPMVSCDSSEKEIEIRAPFDQNDGATDNEQYLFISLPCEKLFSFGLIDEESIWPMICYADRNTNEIIPTNILGDALTVKDDYLYFMHNPDGVCRVKLSELVGGGYLNVEFIMEFDTWGFQGYRIFGERIGYYKCASDLGTSDLDGGNIMLEVGNRWGTEVKYLCGYENGSYYYVASTRSGDEKLSERENKLIEERDGIQTELFFFEESNHRIEWGYIKGFYIYNGYFYYFSGNMLKRRELKNDSQPEIIFQWSDNATDVYMLGILPSGIYVREDNINDVVLRINPDDKSVSTMDFKYNVNDYYFLSNLDNELYHIDFDYANKRTHAVKLTGLLSDK